MVNFQVAERYHMEDLLNIMELLRSPGGCPWDRAQTHQSIRSNMLEEAYEAADAIGRMDMENLKEELGDVLLQVVFHACMAQEAGSFTFDDVADGVCRKLVFRHPNVFGTAESCGSGEALSSWEAQKREEKGQKTLSDTLDGVARALPALTRASKLQHKASGAGFGPADVSSALDRLSGALEGLETAIRAGDGVEENLGRLLFAAVEAGRLAGVDGEDALQSSCEAYIRRFRRMEGDQA